MKWLYHVSRLVLGGWWVFSGVMPFVDPAWQPYGQEPAAIEFTTAMVNSGLMTCVKLAEIVLGLLILANRLMPIVTFAIVPINFVIVWWNLVLETGTVELVFGVLTIMFNAVLVWVWRRYLYALFAWRGTPDYSLPKAKGKRLN